MVEWQIAIQTKVCKDVIICKSGFRSSPVPLFFCPLSPRLQPLTNPLIPLYIKGYLLIQHLLGHLGLFRGCLGVGDRGKFLGRPWATYCHLNADWLVDCRVPTRFRIPVSPLFFS